MPYRPVRPHCNKNPPEGRMIPHWTGGERRWEAIKLTGGAATLKPGQNKPGVVSAMRRHDPGHMPTSKSRAVRYSPPRRSDIPIHKHYPGLAFLALPGPGGLSLWTGPRIKVI